MIGPPLNANVHVTAYCLVVAFQLVQQSHFRQTWIQQQLLLHGEQLQIQFQMPYPGRWWIQFQRAFPRFVVWREAEPAWEQGVELLVVLGQGELPFS